MGYPGDQFCADAQVAINKLYVAAGRSVPLDVWSATWIGRMLYDIGQGMTPEASREKHLAELAAALGPAPAPVPGPVNPRRWRGAFCVPDALPGIPFGDGRRIWTPALACYSGTEWFSRILDAYVSRGYTHLQYLLWGKPYADDYPEITPDPERAYRDLSAIRARGLLPVVTLLYGDHTGAHWEQAQPMIDRCADLLKGAWVFPMFEMNQDLFQDGAVDRKVNGRWVGGLTDCVLETKRRCPEALIAIHMTPNHSTLGDDEIAWCHDMTGVIDAILGQTASFDDPNQAAADMQSSALRYHGKIGGGVPPAWAGCDIDLVAFELTTTRTYRGQMSEAEQIAYTRRVLSLAPELTGYGDGGPR